MNRVYPLYMGLLVAAMLCVACSNDPSSVASDSNITPAIFVANGAQSVVVQTDDYDFTFDGLIDRSEVFTTSYDVHGNAIEVVDEAFVQGARIYHEATANTYNNHGNLISYLTTSYDRGSDIVIGYVVMSTLETDKQGHPLRQKISGDLEADGDFDFSFEQSNTFDSRGRLATRDTGQQKDDYRYDQHDNIARHEMRWAVNNRIIDETLTAEWTVHGSELRSASIVTQTGQPATTHLLTSVAFDRQGYPTRQILDRTRGGLAWSHAIIEPAYDGQHRLREREYSADTNMDGRPDYHLVTRYEYSGLDVAPTRGPAGGQALGLAGAGLSGGLNGKGPDGPSGGRFSR